jgi:hypothetical protein
MDSQNCSILKPSITQQVAHTVKRESGVAEKRMSLLKNSIAELYWVEKHRKTHLSETNSQQFDSKTCWFAFLLAHHLIFSTGSDGK